MKFLSSLVIISSHHFPTPYLLLVLRNPRSPPSLISVAIQQLPIVFGFLPSTCFCLVILAVSCFLLYWFGLIGDFIRIDLGIFVGLLDLIIWIVCWYKLVDFYFDRLMFLVWRVYLSWVEFGGGIRISDHQRRGSLD